MLRWIFEAIAFVCAVVAAIADYSDLKILRLVATIAAAATLILHFAIKYAQSRSRNDRIALYLTHYCARLLEEIPGGAGSAHVTSFLPGRCTTQRDGRFIKREGMIQRFFSPVNKNPEVKPLPPKYFHLPDDDEKFMISENWRRARNVGLSAWFYADVDSLIALNNDHDAWKDNWIYKFKLPSALRNSLTELWHKVESVWCICIHIPSDDPAKRTARFEMTLYIGWPTKSLVTDVNKKYGHADNFVSLIESWARGGFKLGVDEPV